MFQLSLLIGIALALTRPPSYYIDKHNHHHLPQNAKNGFISLTEDLILKTYDFGVALGKGAPIYAHDNIVLAGETPLYIIFYGPGWGDTGSLAKFKPLLFNLFANLYNSSWLGAARFYAYGIGNIQWNESMVVTLPYMAEYGNSQVSDLALQQLVADLINKGVFPYSSNAIYMLIGDADTGNYFSEQRFGIKVGDAYGKQYCGYHLNSTMAEGRLVYSFIGVGATGCNNPPFYNSGQAFTEPNDHMMDPVISTIMHEISESQTDPYFNGWRGNSTESENADLCAWSYGKCALVPHTQNHIFNYRVGDYFYLIQQMYIQTSMSKYYCSSKVWQDGNYTLGYDNSVAKTTQIVLSSATVQTTFVSKGVSFAASVYHRPLNSQQQSSQISSDTLTYIGVGIFIFVALVVFGYFVYTNIKGKSKRPEIVIPLAKRLPSQKANSSKAALKHASGSSTPMNYQSNPVSRNQDFAKAPSRNLTGNSQGSRL